MDTQELLNKDIISAIGFDALLPEEQDEFISQIGTVLLESALTKLMVELNDEQLKALDYYLEDEPSADILLKHLFDQYPQFESIMQEETVAFKQEMLELFEETEK